MTNSQGRLDNQDRFHCGVCGQAYVVPSLATDCATKHEGAS